MDACSFNARERATGRLTPVQVALLLERARTTDLEAAVHAFQATHGLKVDGFAGPITRAAIDAELARQPTTVGPVPCELIMYQRQLPPAHGDLAKAAYEYARFLADHGFVGLVIESTNEPAIRHADDLRRGGMQWLGISRFPHGFPFEPGLADMKRDADRIGAERVYVDAEGKIYALHEDRCRAFADAVELLFALLVKVFTSYPGFPAKWFARKGWLLALQLYDRFDDRSADWIAKELARVHGIGFDEEHGGLGAYTLDRHDTSKAWTRELDSFREHLASAQRARRREAEVWSLPSFQTDYRAHAAHYAALARFARGETP